LDVFETTFMNAEYRALSTDCLKESRVKPDGN